MSDAPKRAVRPRKKTAAAKAVADKAPGSRAPQVTVPANPWEGLLDTGDALSVGASMEIKDSRGRSYWPKVSVTVHKRAGESEDQTATRASQVAHEVLHAHAKQFLED